MDIDFNESINEGILTIHPSAHCDCQETLIYKLSSTKNSESGISSSSQSGRFYLEPNQPTYLSKLSVNLTDDIHYTTTLIISDLNGNVLIEKEFNYP